MTLTTRINILNLDIEDTSAMDLWKVIAEFAGFPFSTCNPIVKEETDEYGEADRTEVRSPFGVGARAWVSVTYNEDGYNPITVLLDTVYGDDCCNIHNEIVVKLVEHLSTIEPNVVVLSCNEYTRVWIVNGAPY